MRRKICSSTRLILILPPSSTSRTRNTPAAEIFSSRQLPSNKSFCFASGAAGCAAGLLLMKKSYKPRSKPAKAKIIT